MKQKPANTGVLAGAAVSAVLSVVSVLMMISYRERGDFGYTGALDYTLRMVLLLACAVLFVLAMVRLAFHCVKGGDAHRAVGGALSLLGFGLLCSMVVVGISLYREFQNSSRLLEDAMFFLLTMAAALAVLMSKAMRGKKKGIFVTSVVAAAFLAVCVALDLALFGAENTYRTINAVYYLQRLGYVLPFAVTVAAAKLLLPEDAGENA